MYYLLLYDVVDGYVEKRTQHRTAHLAYAKAAVERGELALGGAFAEPVDQAGLLFEGDDPSVAVRFAEGDPYVRNGLVTSWRVRPWNIVMGTKA